MQKYKLTVDIGLCGCTREETVSVEDMGYTVGEWAEMDEGERDAEVEEYLGSFMERVVSTDWSEVES